MKPPAPAKRLPKAVPLATIEQLLEAASAPGTPLALRDRALLEVLYGTGARISEAVGLDVDDVELDSDDPVDHTVLLRGRRSLAADLKDPQAVAAVLRVVAGADALLEGFRPGVAERLGLGPRECLARSPGLVYGRMTGWGQDEDRARSRAAGFDGHLVKPVDFAALDTLMASLSPPQGG